MPARRGRSRVPAFAVLVLAAAVVGTVIGVCSRSAPGASEAVSVDSLPMPVEPDPDFVGRTVEAGENLVLVLTTLGLPAEETRATVDALGRTDFDFQRMMPGDSLTLELVDSLPVRLRYHLDLATSYEVRLAGDSVSAARVMVPVETTVVALVGAVRGSLWQSLLEVGADDRPAAAFTCILRHHLPPLRRMRAGDSFHLVVERLAVADSFYGFGNVHALGYRGETEVEAFHHARPDGVTFYCDARGRSLDRVLSYPPIPGARMTSDFGPRLHPVARRRVQHYGIDFEAPYGTPVRAVADGVVRQARARRGFGRMVELVHKQPRLNTRYAHLSRYAEGVRVGVALRQGDIVGYVGSTGLSSGAHLHFETVRGGRQVNPLDVLPARVEEVEPGAQVEFERFVADCRALVARASAGGKESVE